MKKVLSKLHTRGKKRISLSELERRFIIGRLEVYDRKKEVLPSFVVFYTKLLSKLYKSMK